MGKLTTADFEFNASFDINAAKPFDTRWLVDDVESIEYPYKGLLVLEYKEGSSSLYKYYDGATWKTLFDAGNNKVLSSQLPVGNQPGNLVALGNDSKIPSNFLPSYVDDVIEAYYDSENDAFYEHYDAGTYSDLITGETSKIYVDLLTNKAYRWSGHTYIEISQTNEIVLTQDLIPTVTVGGVTKGVANKIDAGTSIETVLRKILAPALNPTLTAPSATITSDASSLLCECGDEQTVDFTITFNRGSIDPAYGTSGYRSGAATGYKLNAGTEQASNVFENVSILLGSEGTLTYTGNVLYAAGEQPKNSEGADYSSALAAGNVDSNTITFEFVNRVWDNTADKTQVVAQNSLVSLANDLDSTQLSTIKLILAYKNLPDSTLKTYRFVELNFTEHTTSNPYTFDIPQAWIPNGMTSVRTIRMYSNVSTNYGGDDIKSKWDISTTTHKNAANADVNYYRFEYNEAAQAGSNRFIIVW
jgi:hypothetical protein